MIRLSPVTREVFAELLSWQNVFYLLAIVIGLDVSEEAGLLVLILWQQMKLTDILSDRKCTPLESDVERT